MTSAERGTVVVRRPWLGWADRFRAYRVMVDEVEIGRVRNDETLKLPLTPGSHRVQLLIDWTGSNPVNVQVEPGREIALVVKRLGNMFSREGYLSLSADR